jgi:hypothetical protein
MCYSAKDSLLAYGINTVGCAALFFFARDAQFKVLALFLLFVGQMQLFDYYFWTHQKCDKENNVATKFAIAFNHYQPSVLFFLQYLYGFKQSIESVIVLGAYSLYSSLYSFKAFEEVDCTLPKNGQLDWKWTELDGNLFLYSLFILYLIVASFNFIDMPVKIAAAAVSVVTYFAASKKEFLNIHFGRAWCYYASFMPLLFLGLNVYLK